MTVKPYGVSKRVRRVLGGASTSAKKSTSGFLDLGNEKDVADFLLRRRGEAGPPGADGYESAASSASSAGEEDVDAVSLADDYVGRNNKKGQKRAVKLDEIGPRMELRLIKISEGVPGKEGGVIYHELGMCTFEFLLFKGLTAVLQVKKSKKEVSALKTAHAEKEKLRKDRREEQERNVERKKKLANKGKHAQEDDEEEDGGEHEEEEEGAWDDDEEISEGEEVLSEAEESEPEEPRPQKKAKLRGKR